MLLCSVRSGSSNAPCTLKPARWRRSLTFALGRNSDAAPVFYIGMKRVALVAVLALSIVVLFVFGLWLRVPVQPAASSPPQAMTVHARRVSSRDFQTRLREIVVRAAGATETESASLGRAQVVPDSSRNAVHRISVATAGR